MKTKTALLKFLFVLPLAFLAAACGKSGGSSSTAVSGYYSYNQQCYQSGTVTPVAYTSCQTGTVYRWQNNICYGPSNNDVGVGYCNNNQVFTNTGYGYNNGLNNGLNGGLNNGVNGVGSIGGGFYAGGSIGGSYGAGYGQPTCVGYTYIQGYGNVYCGQQNQYCYGAVAMSNYGAYRCQ